MNDPTGLNFEKIIRHRTWVFILLFAVACIAGCGKGPDPSFVQEDPAVEPTGDAAVLRALEAYNPIYRIDDDGRVVNLKLEGRHITPPVLDEVRKLTELVTLSLYAASLTDDDLEKIDNLTKLDSLGLGATNITEKGFDHLLKLQSLKWTWVPKERITQEQAEAFQQKSGARVFRQ